MTAQVEHLMALADELETQLAASRDIGETCFTSFVIYNQRRELINADQTRHLESRAKADTLADNHAAQ